MTSSNSTLPRLKIAESRYGFLKPESRRLMTLSQNEAWGGILGRAPLPLDTVRLGNWMIVPVHEDTSQFPSRTLERVQAIYAAGLRPKGFVLVHEAPKLLPGTTVDEQPRMHWPAFIPTSLNPILKIAAFCVAAFIALMTIVVGLAVLFMVAALVVAMLALPLMFVVAASAGLDPILVAVTEDDYWVEIDRWRS